MSESIGPREVFLAPALTPPPVTTFAADQARNLQLPRVRLEVVGRVVSRQAARFIRRWAVVLVASVGLSNAAFQRDTNDAVTYCALLGYPLISAALHILTETPLVRIRRGTIAA